MKVLYTTPVLEHPPAGGPQLRVENSIKALARTCELHLASRVPRAALGGKHGEHFYRGLCHAFTYAPQARIASAPPGFRKIARQLNSLFPVDEAHWLLEYAARHDIDVIWFGYGNISFPLIRDVKHAKPDIRVACDTDSVWSRFLLRELPHVPDPARRELILRRGREKQAEEQAWVNLCDVTTAVSEVDAEYYRGIAADPARIRIFSNGIDLATYTDRPVRPAGLPDPYLYLAGSFEPGSAMDQAARWLTTEIMPLVWQTRPDMHLVILGRGSLETLSDITDRRITITGKLPSALPHLCHATAALVPLRFESGTRFKIMEAAACGIPVVSTHLGAEGIPVSNRLHMMLADTAVDFAKAILEIVQQPEQARQMAQTCRNLVQKQYSIDALTNEAQAILTALAHD